MKNRRELLTQGGIEEKIIEDLEALEGITDDYADICKKLAKAEVAYKRRRYSAYSRTKGTIKDRESYAESVAIDDFDKFKSLEAEKDGLYQIIWTIRNRIEALRSLNTNVRNQV